MRGSVEKSLYMIKFILNQQTKHTFEQVVRFFLFAQYYLILVHGVLKLQLKDGYDTPRGVDNWIWHEFLFDLSKSVSRIRVV